MGMLLPVQIDSPIRCCNEQDPRIRAPSKTIYQKCLIKQTSDNTKSELEIDHSTILVNGSTAVNDLSAKKCEVQSELEENKKNPIPAHFCSKSTATAQ